MRWVAALLALGVMTAPSIASATSCVGPPWSRIWHYDQDSPVDGFPVDAKPWLRVACNTTTQGCSLVADDHTVSLTLAAYDEVCAHDEFGAYVVEMTASEALLPAHTYALACETLAETVYGSSDVYEEIVLHTRATTTPSSPPSEVEVTRARQIRGDATFLRCDDGVTIGLTMADHDDAYLREGGRIEVTYADGEALAITGVTDGEVLLPYTDGPIALTPVAADGARGATVTVAPEEVEDQAVYIPCRSSVTGSSHGLWLLAPALWIGSRRRRRIR